MPELLSQKEAAEFLGFKYATLTQWRMTGKGPIYIRIGRMVKYPKESLLKYLEDNTTDNTVNKNK